MHERVEDGKISRVYELVELAGGVWTLRSKETGETFHPVLGPEAEALALHVDQADFLRRVREHDRLSGGKEPFVVWDVGLGAAANALTVLRAARGVGGRTRLISFDHSLAPALFGFEHAEKLAYFDGYKPVVGQLLASARAAGDVPAPGVERAPRSAGSNVEPSSNRDVRAIFQDGAREVEWVWVCADYPTWIDAYCRGLAGATDGNGDGNGVCGMAPPHMIMYDAFSPARNPAMWTAGVFRDLRAALGAARPCTLATFSRSTMIRVTLLLAGFYVGIGRPIAEKEETTMASTHLDLIERPLGARWLDRVRASTNAEPLVSAVYRREPISENTWSALRAHPQFQSGA